MLLRESANLLLDEYLESGESYFAGLLASIPVPTDTESTINEVSYGGYERVATTFNSSLWNAAANSSKTNQAAITFPTATSTASPRETCKGAFFVTESSGGVVVCAGKLIQPLEIIAGKQLIIQPGYLTVFGVFSSTPG